MKESEREYVKGGLDEAAWCSCARVLLEAWRLIPSWGDALTSWWDCSIVSLDSTASSVTTDFLSPYLHTHTHVFELDLYHLQWLFFLHSPHNTCFKTFREFRVLLQFELSLVAALLLFPNWIQIYIALFFKSHCCLVCFLGRHWQFIYPLMQI